MLYLLTLSVCNQSRSILVRYVTLAMLFVRGGGSEQFYPPLSLFSQHTHHRVVAGLYDYLQILITLIVNYRLQFGCLTEQSIDAQKLFVQQAYILLLELIFHGQL